MGDLLKELVPRKVRLVIYLVVSLVALVIGIWQQAEGNTLVFVVNLAVALQGALASANLNPPEQQPITLEDASIDYIVDVFEERGITIQDLADAGLHLNTNPETHNTAYLFDNLSDTAAPPNLGQ